MKAKKKTPSQKCVICIIIILAVLAIGLTLFASRKNADIMARWSRPTLCYNQSCLYVQVASTEYQRKQGLMHNRNLDEDKWLLMDFRQPGIYSLGMKNVLIPLDIVWLDQNYTILYIKNTAPPCTLDPCPVFASPVPARYILEINAWIAEKIWLAEWETFTFTK